MGKDFFKSLFLAGTPFGIVMGLLFGIWGGLSFGILFGVLSGVLFGVAISSFIQIQSKKFKRISSEVTKGKTVIMDGGANHFKGPEAVGGWIYLTSDEIIFISHSINVQIHQTVIHLEEIVNLKAVATLGIIPNGLQIAINNGTIEKFVVNNRKDWIKRINNAISELRSSLS